MTQEPIRPMPKFEGAEDFKIKRNQAARIVLPAYPSNMDIPPDVGIAMYREKVNGEPANAMETAPYQSPAANKETLFELTLEEMTYIAGPDIKFVTLQERYSAQSGGGAYGYGEKSAPYEVID